MMIRAVGATSLIARHASMPDRFGIRTSIRITSGTVGRGQRRGRDAVAGLADHLDVVLHAEQHGQPAAEQLLVVDDGDADGLAAGLEALLADPPRDDHGMSGASRSDFALEPGIASARSSRHPVRRPAQLDVEGDHPVVVAPPAVDDRGTLGVLVDEQEEVVARPAPSRRAPGRASSASAGCDLLPDHQRAVTERR